MPDPFDKTERFRQLHRSGFFLLPNAWDRGSAVRLADAGFSAIASTSAGAAWAAGKQDGELGLHEVLDHLRMLVESVSLPVNADFENGFADAAEDVAVNVGLAVQTGVAAVSIEDWSGTAMYETELAIDRIRAARAAIDAFNPNIMLVGRNENFRTPGMSAEASISRAVAYAQAGADCLFVPFLLDHGVIAELVQAVAPKPVNVVVHNYDENIPALAALGVRRCSVGGSLAKRVWGAFDDAAQALKHFETLAHGARPGFEHY